MILGNRGQRVWSGVAAASPVVAATTTTVVTATAAGAASVSAAGVAPTSVTAIDRTSIAKVAAEGRSIAVVATIVVAAGTEKTADRADSIANGAADCVGRVANRATDSGAGLADRSANRAASCADRITGGVERATDALLGSQWALLASFFYLASARRSYFGVEPLMKALSTPSRCCFIVFPAAVASPAAIASKIF